MNMKNRMIPQLENGYTTIANEIIDNFQRLSLSQSEWKILWVVLRQTYGWNKKEDRISLSQFQEKTGLNRPLVIRSLSKLVSKRILVINKNGYINSYSFNKLHSQWGSIQTDTTSKLVSKQILGSIQMDTGVVSKQIPKLVSKQIHTKEKKTNIQKTIAKAIGKKLPNPEIDLIISLYKKHMGFSPTDRKPRQVAQNIRQITNTFIKEIKPYKEFTFEEVITRAFAWYMEREEMKGETLDVFKRKMRILLEKTFTKYKGGDAK